MRSADVSWARAALSNAAMLAEWKMLVRKGVVPDDWMWNRDPGTYL